MAVDLRKAKLAAKAAAAGYRLEESDGTFMLVDPTTGTWLLARWSDPGGFGLSLDEIEAALTG